MNELEQALGSGNYEKVLELTKDQKDLVSVVYRSKTGMSYTKNPQSKRSKRISS